MIAKLTKTPGRRPVLISAMSVKLVEESPTNSQNSMIHHLDGKITHVSEDLDTVWRMLMRPDIPEGKI